MIRNEKQTCRDLIEPTLNSAGWEWDPHVLIGHGRVNITGEAMYDETQAIIADYVLRYRGIPLAVLEAKAESSSAADAMQQDSRYAQRLDIRFSIASNGTDWILTDNESGVFETIASIPTPEDILTHHGVSIDLERWGDTFSAGYHVDQINRKKVRP